MFFVLSDLLQGALDLPKRGLTCRRSGSLSTHL
jgi:hypothetical protein